ncbi:MAG: diaminopimelate decarboxylase [Bryobacteraceae bacterium]|nr:diaminopimelate decarboxylase [Bryobacteraceae bacterium]
MANPIERREGVLFCENVELETIAREAGTPVYVYSAGGIRARYREYAAGLEGMDARVCYAVKANGNLSVLRLLAAEGAGFDIVSGGELDRVLRAGGDPAKVVFAGVGKTREEIEFALETGIAAFNCESEAEIALIDALAGRMGKRASAAVRVNPDVNPETHPYISTGLREHKFGIDIHGVEEVYERARGLRNVSLEGVACHIGSQLLDASPLLEAAQKMVELAVRLRARGFAIRHLDLGGGLGVPYKPGDARPDVGAFLRALRGIVVGTGLRLWLEPGRSIVAEAGVLLARVLYRKSNGDKEFIVVDASMTELIRPALYGAHHEIVPLRKSRLPGTVTADVVGPVCETGDFLARGRELPQLMPGDFVAVMTAGAYGWVASSNYNARPRPAEVLVDGTGWGVARKRETYEDLVRGEA